MRPFFYTPPQDKNDGTRTDTKKAATNIAAMKYVSVVI